MIDTNTASNVNDKSDSKASGSPTEGQAGKAGKGKIRITKEQVVSARKLLAGLKPVKKAKEVQDGFSGQDFVKEMYPEILAAGKKGYSLQQIADMLTAQAKVEIPVSTLKNYMSRVKAEKKKEGKGEPEKSHAGTAALPASTTNGNIG